MTEFRTNFSINPLKNKLDYNNTLISFGSCFSENIGKNLSDNKFNILVNPFGILYNPESIANSMNILFKEKLFTKDDLFNQHGVWKSFYHHSRFSNTNANQCLNLINESIKKGSEQLKNANYIFITFGTAWVYELKQTGKIVSNCHKVPAKEFSRYRLTSCDIVESYQTIIKHISSQNSSCEFIFTVSPVRHLKDGAIENQLSKSTLLLAVNELVESFKNVHYFPSYEIMMDDLRDYRFYADDMVHPSKMAISYIWEQFKKACIHENTAQTMNEINKIKNALNHRPFQPQAETYKSFLKNTLEKIETLTNKFPYMNFTDEIHKINLNL